MGSLFGGKSAPSAPAQVKGGGIETPIKSNDEQLLAMKKKNQQNSATVLGGGSDRKEGL